MFCDAVIINIEWRSVKQEEGWHIPTTAADMRCVRCQLAIPTVCGHLQTHEWLLDQRRVPELPPWTNMALHGEFIEYCHLALNQKYSLLYYYLWECRFLRNISLLIIDPKIQLSINLRNRRSVADVSTLAGECILWSYLAVSVSQMWGTWVACTLCTCLVRQCRWYECLKLVLQYHWCECPGRSTYLEFV